MSEKGATYDDGKVPLAWLPWAAMRAIAKVQQYGHKKYKDFNNYRKGIEVTRNLSCALRHITEYLDGQDNDPESGEPHLAHAACRIAFVLQNIHDGTVIDDRYKKPVGVNEFPKDFDQQAFADHINHGRLTGEKLKTLCSCQDRGFPAKVCNCGGER